MMAKEEENRVHLITTNIIVANGFNIKRGLMMMGLKIIQMAIEIIKVVLAVMAVAMLIIWYVNFFLNKFNHSIVTNRMVQKYPCHKAGMQVYRILQWSLHVCYSKTNLAAKRSSLSANRSNSSG